jgi:hypothetical protein
VDDRYGVPGERPARGSMAEHLPVGFGLAFFFVPVPAWGTVRLVAWHQGRCGGTTDELYLLITLLPLLAIGYALVFACTYALVQRVAQARTAFVVAFLVLGAVTALTGSLLVDVYAPDPLCALR